MASSKSSSMLTVTVTVAVVAALLTGAWCLDEEGLVPDVAPTPGSKPSFAMTVEEGSGGKKLVVFVQNLREGGGMQNAQLWVYNPTKSMGFLSPVPNSASSIAAHDPKSGSVFTFESKEPLKGPFTFQITYSRTYAEVIPDKYTIGDTYKTYEADAV